MHQRTFVLIKPDGVQRRLVGRIITAFEEAGLQITQLSMLRPMEETADKLYPASSEWLRTAGNKAIQDCKEAGLNILDLAGTEEPEAIGQIIKKRLVEFLCSGNVVIMIVEGNLAVANVRRLVGNTLPLSANPSTIRGRYGIDSPDQSFREKRPVLNLVHASGNVEEAEFEIQLWFGHK